MTREAINALMESHSHLEREHEEGRYVALDDLPSEDRESIQAFFADHLPEVAGCRVIGYSGCGGSPDCGPKQQKHWLSKECPKSFICPDCA